LARVLPSAPAAIEEAVRLLRAGRLVAFPTETVYGLGALAGDLSAVAAVYRAKRRPAHNPLIAHVADADAARRIAAFDARANRLAEAFWPGPLTLVLPLAAQAEIAPAATAGLSTVAVRVPSHPTAQALLREVGLPVVAPSANPSGRVSPTTAQHVAAELGEAVDLVLDGGPCPVGLESTVVDLSDPEHARLLRPGGLPRDRLESLLGELRTAAPTDRPSSPGQLASHYAPRLPIRLDAGSVEPDEALLAFGPNPPTDALAMLNLSPTGDLAEAARNLFAMLHDLDRSGAARIAVMPIPAEGLGEAIRDRLRRAAAPRPG
jgi:L-threonylcarbamoyladenylate synthase